jgi:hypothetical protein
VNPEYRGAGTNFLVNFPGFLVFAPAWNGYKYQANPRTSVVLRSSAGQTTEAIAWQHNYEFHQADIGRTWTQISWLEFGVIAFIGGVAFVSYDTDQTEPFIETVRTGYGRQIAHLISQRAARLDTVADARSRAPDSAERAN